MDINFKLPKNAVLELTYQCNQKCKFCSCPWENTGNPELHYEKYNELSINEWKSALIVLKQLGVRCITVSGGETLLKEGLGELLYFIRENTSLNQNTSIIVITNGATMSEEFITLFKKTNVHLSLSLPGLTTFLYHTESTVNSPENILYWLKRANEESINTTVNVTVTGKNYFELYETLANGLIAGAGTVLVNRVLVGGRGLSYVDELSLTKEELQGILFITEEVLSLSKRTGSIGTEYPYCLIPEKCRKNKQFRIGSECAAANGFFVIDPSGYIRTCNHSAKRVGFIFDDEIISDMEYWNMFANKKFNLPDMCNGCSFIEKCACGCREAAILFSGSISDPDPCFASFDNMQK